MLNTDSISKAPEGTVSIKEVCQSCHQVDYKKRWCKAERQVKN